MRPMTFDETKVREWIVRRDFSEALPYLKHHADNGSVLSLIALAHYYSGAGDNAASDKCMERAEKAIQPDDFDGHVDMASAYQTGLGARDYRRRHELALFHMQIVGEAGNPEIQISLLLHYLQGLNGAPEDKVRALYWAKRAARSGSVRARIVVRNLEQEGSNLININSRPEAG